MRWTGILIMAGAALSLAACSTYPAEPRYSTRPMSPGAVAPLPPPGSTPSASETWSDEPPPPARAPVERIDGGALPPPAAAGSTSPAYAPPPAASASLAPGAAYVIQPGDTISGVGRRFQTPVQVLIDLNGLGPRGAIASGQRVILPDSAVDTGPDPYATGPSPVGVLTPDNGAPPPPPPPPSGNAALPPPARSPAVGAPPATTSAAAGMFQWPVRGDIVRRFGPVGLGERNNGVNIAAPAGTEVRAAAAGRVAYVGDDLVGQGLTVLVVHRDGWRTVYGHLGSATVRDGDDVRQGQTVGTVGLTAGDGRPSMHFETRHMRNDEPLAIDPLTVLPR